MGQINQSPDTELKWPCVLCIFHLHSWSRETAMAEDLLPIMAIKHVSWAQDTPRLYERIPEKFALEWLK